MILWYLDRFGLPGRYYSTWATLLHMSGINPSAARCLSLHQQTGRQLLTRYANRKAPQWIPEMTGVIVDQMAKNVKQFQPKAVVLASPESLAILGLSPEIATLHTLRGSVYWLEGIPHIVMLPMSSWFVSVTQKDIGAANYGFESTEALSAATIDVTRDGDNVFRQEPGGFAESANLGIREHIVAQDDVLDNVEEDSTEDSTVEDDVEVDVSTDDSADPNSDSVEDAFFYEPVLSPVGRFVLTADCGKLARIVKDGVRANGPKEPYTLKYR